MQYKKRLIPSANLYCHHLGCLQKAAAEVIVYNPISDRFGFALWGTRVCAYLLYALRNVFGTRLFECKRGRCNRNVSPPNHQRKRSRYLHKTINKTHNSQLFVFCQIKYVKYFIIQKPNILLLCVLLKFLRVVIVCQLPRFNGQRMQQTPRNLSMPVS